MGYGSHGSWCYALTTMKLENSQHNQPHRLQQVTSVSINQLCQFQVLGNFNEHTSREMFGQYEASKTRRFAQVWAISRSVSSLTHEQFDISKDSKRGHAVAAERIAASESLWHEAISRSCKRGQLSTACGMLLRLSDNVSSCGHL